MAGRFGKCLSHECVPAPKWKYKFTISCKAPDWGYSLSPTDVTADTALSLDGTGRLDYSLKQGPKRDVLLRRALQGATTNPTGPSSLEVKFRTRGKTGTLLHVQESSNYTTVKVCKTLIYTSKVSEVSLICNGVKIQMLQKHMLSLKCSNSSALKPLDQSYIWHRGGPSTIQESLLCRDWGTCHFSIQSYCLNCKWAYCWAHCCLNKPEISWAIARRIESLKNSLWL